MTETKITCEGCGQWIGRLPNVIGNAAKSWQIAKDAGWISLWISNNIKGRHMSYCPPCAKKVSIKEMFYTL